MLNWSTSYPLKTTYFLHHYLLKTLLETLLASSKHFRSKIQGLISSLNSLMSVFHLLIRADSAYSNVTILCYWGSLNLLPSEAGCLIRISIFIRIMYTRRLLYSDWSFIRCNIYHTCWLAQARNVSSIFLWFQCAFK